MPRPAPDLNPFCELLWVSESEMDELYRKASLVAAPMYLSVSPAGRLRTWPAFDPKVYRMFVKSWDGGK